MSSDRKIRAKVKRRERVLVSLDRHVQFLQDYDAAIHKGQIQTRLEKLEAKWEEFEEIQEEIVALDEAGKWEEDLNAAAELFEAQYYEIRAKLEEKLDVPAPVPAVPPLDTSVGRNASALGLHTGVRLPQISLPEFDGDYRGWLSFKSTFTSLIHESAELSEVQKFHYLKSALKGEAAKLIESLTITNENYAIAWETITKRYSNEYLLKKRHLQAIMEFQKIQKESAAEIHRLVDEFEQRLKILKQLGEKTEHWGALVVHIMCSKLDVHTLQLWEDHAASIKEPNYTALVSFLEKRTRVLDAVSSNTAKVSQPTKPVIRRERMAVHAATDGERSSPSCPCCGDLHYLVKCGKFSSLNLRDKLGLINSKRLCSNCFRTGHWVRDCNAKFCCKTCGKKHNTLIHPGFSSTSGSSSSGNASTGQSTKRSDTTTSNAVVEVEADDADEETESVACNIGTKGRPSNVFLSTVVVAVRDYTGGKQLARALLDNGSQVNLISERLCQMLKLKRRAVNVPISGVGQTESRARHAVTTAISSRVTEFSIGMDFLVLQRVTSDIPSVTVSTSNWKIPDGMKLADPHFNTSSRIDLLIGAEHFFQFLAEREMKRVPLGPGLPVLVDSVFGWIVSGRCSESGTRSANCCLAVASENLEGLLERFWQVESCDDRPAWSAEEIDCEENFSRTVCREADGRYTVRLPKHPNLDRMLGESKHMALDRFVKLEKRLERNPEMKDQYQAFIQEYLDMGHMRMVTEDELEAETQQKVQKMSYYLPHHAVVKDSSTTTKVRVVFDGSARTDSGYSLNDVLLKGPTIQDDLLSLLLRFRKYEVALVGDIEKMYRQVQLSREDTPLQRIFWRFSKDEPIAVYELLTVTYGLTPSSFLATRALKQLAADEEANHPQASAALVKDFYVDDYIGGADSVEEAILLRQELSTLMAKGGFPLRKWCSNRSEVLSGVPEDQLGTNLSITFELNPGEEIKTLGITWEPKADQLRFVFDITDGEEQWTRRRILSSIAKLFDPLGLISPVVVTAKILMQELALLQSGWDSPVPTSLEQKWILFHSQLSKLSELRIDRFAFASEYVTIQIHTFADASESAYGACLYVRTKDSAGNVRVELMSAKSRVAPLKRLTLPRLELCAAKEAATLYQKVVQALGIHNVESFFWSDSTVVLHWLKAPPNTWKTFIANRVSAIQTATYGHHWRHVSGKENPADLVSRGMSVDEFLQSQLWKSGPSWLMEPPASWPDALIETEPTGIDLETRNTVQIVTTVAGVETLFTLRNSFEHLLRIVAYCIRFASNSRKTDQNQRNLLPYLTASEITAAKQAVILFVQRESFSEDLKGLKKHHQVSSKSPLKLLCPFLDTSGVIRVGGRLRHSLENYSTQHPAVLPSSHAVTKLAIEYFHRRTAHGGCQLTLAVMRQEFWPIHGKKAVTSVLRQCTTCFRVNPTAIQQPMGQLPAARVRPARPFLITGVDYCGPFYLKPPHRRAAPPKIYIAVFVCFTTKAIHLEMVSDLSTAGFLSALRRFIGYHGMPKEIHSDNATNFAGANHELNQLYKLLHDKATTQQVGDELAHQGITWHFIPPRAPNFGGLWEAAVRSAKTAIKKEIGTHQLTHENFHTLLVQISAALNSRPLTPLSDDPSDLDALTPAHFLIGCSMKALPERNLLDIPTNRLTHYQQRQQMFQHYWQRWSKEYLTELQPTSKGQQASPIRIGSIVVLREDNSPPLHWPLAKIVDTHPGADGIVRVVTVKTANGIYKRPINRICSLPTQECADVDVDQPQT